MMHRAKLYWRDPNMKTGYTGNVHAAYNQVQNATKRKKPNKVDLQELNNQIMNINKHGKANKNVHNDFLQTPIDRYTPSLEGVADPATIDRLWKETDYMADAVRKLVQSSIGKNDACGQCFWAIRAKIDISWSDANSTNSISIDISLSGSNKTEGAYKLSEAERAQAEELISEDGFFGVNQTTARIMDFAKALVGESASGDRIELMRTAVQKGFDEVARLFGGFNSFPDVTKQTYESIMKAFDEWLGINLDDDTAE